MTPKPTFFPLYQDPFHYIMVPKSFYFMYSIALERK